MNQNGLFFGSIALQNVPTTMKLRARDGRRHPIGIRRLLPIHILSLKIAALSGGLTLIVGVAISLFSDLGGLVFAAMLAVTAFLVTYISANTLLRDRIELAHTTLRRARKYHFEALRDADFPKGDELNDLIRQVYRTGQALEREINQLRRIANYRRSFIGDVSHELKTPIFSIQGYAETLLDRALEDPSVNRSFVEKILRNAERLRNLTADLTEISRLESGELTMTFEPFRLSDMIPEIVESLESTAAKRKIRINATVAEELSPVTGDEQRIRQVVINLLDNAIKYTDANGSVEIRAEIGKKHRVVVSVIDSGIGIPKKHIPRITERFYRVDQSRSRSAGGTGLGLAIVKHILAAHDQKIQVTSTPGEGSTFRFTLPIAAATPAATR